MELMLKGPAQVFDRVTVCGMEVELTGREEKERLVGETPANPGMTGAVEVPMRYRAVPDPSEAPAEN